MKTTMTLATIGLGVLLASAPVQAQTGSEVKFEDVVKEMLGLMDELTKSLASIKDEETAKAARPELQKAATRFVELRKKSETRKPPSREEKDRLEKEYREKLQVAQKKLNAEVRRVEDVPGGRTALKEIKAVFDKKETFDKKESK